jgi:predicted  nucleic acid-binding Zn-ribbon protein
LPDKAREKMIGELLTKYWAVIWAVLTTIGLVIMALLSKTYAKQETVVTLQQKVNSLESSLNQLPTEKELHQLNLEISGLRGELQSLVPRLDQVQKLSDLLLENELKERKSS